MERKFNIQTNIHLTSEFFNALNEVLSINEEEKFFIKSFPVYKIGPTYEDISTLSDIKKTSINIDFGYPIPLIRTSSMRTVIILPNAIVSIMKKYKDVLQIIGDWERSMHHYLHHYLDKDSEIRTFDENLSLGNIHLLSNGDYSSSEIISDILSGSWENIYISEIGLEGLIRKGKKGALVYFSPFQITESILMSLARYQEIDGFTLARYNDEQLYFEQILGYHKEIIRKSVESYGKLKTKQDMLVVPYSNDNPKLLTNIFMDLLIKEMTGEDVTSQASFPFFFNYRTFRMKKKDDDELYVTILPNRLIFTKKLPDLKEPLKELDNAMKKQFDFARRYESVTEGIMYYSPSHNEEEVEVKVDFNYFGVNEKLTIRGFGGDNYIHFPTEEVNNFLINAIQAELKSFF